MNKNQKLVQQQFLNNEKEVIRRLRLTYGQALKDVNENIKTLEMDINGVQATIDMFDNMGGSPDDKAKLQSMLQSKIYQKQYQEAIHGQIDDVMKKLHKNAYATVDEYMNDCYSEAFIGAAFDLHGQGIPLIMPIDQESIVRAVQIDSKINKGLYFHLGESVNGLKQTIATEVSRGLVNGSSYAQIAQQIGFKMVGTYQNPGGAMAYAMRIARTEGHRIQCQAGMDACYKAKEMGADVVKQWDSTLDGDTRESHKRVDGEIRELDEPFSNGLDYPGDPSGGAGEVVNCRCALLERARWALDEDELETLKQRAEFFELDKSENFEDFKKKYLKAIEQAPAKKEYLTKKKLEQNIADGNTQLQSLKQAFADELEYDSYDDFYKDHKDLDDALNDAMLFGTPDEIHKLKQQVAKAKAIQTQIDDLQKQIDDWDDLLDKKLVKSEMKSLKKQQKALQDQLDNMDVKTYQNIWKDDVTTLDYPMKKGSIAAKRSYFEQQLKYATDPDDIKKWQGLLDDLDDFEKHGEEYFKVKTQLDDVSKNLTKLQKNGTMKHPKIDDAFSQDRKDAALWFDQSKGGFYEADKYFDPPAQALYKNATKQEFDGFYTYTSGSGGHNRPLAGFEKPWSEYGSGWEPKFYKGSKNVWIDFEGKGDDIRGLTTLIEKSVYDQDVWLQSGQNFATLEGVAGIPYGTLQNMSDSELQQFVGQRIVFEQFLSTAVNEGGGSIFNSKPMKFNIYAPKGSQMLYASDKGAFGKGENEMILQRGGTYEITKAYWGRDHTDGNRRKLFVDMEIHPEEGYDLFQQDPSEWTGSRKNYRS